MKKTILVLIVSIFLVSLIGASISHIGAVKKDECVALPQTCDCTYNNISRITYPNKSVGFENVVMTRDDTYFNYTFCDTEALGLYIVDGYGDIDGTKDTWNFRFEVNAIGFESTPARSAAANRGSYIIFGIAALLFVGFLFIPKQKTTTDDVGNVVNAGNNRPIKWTFFLLSILFLALAMNVTFISIYNEIGDVQIGAIYDNLAAASLYFFWFSFGLLLILWMFTTIATLADKKRMKQAEATGQPVDLGKY